MFENIKKHECYSTLAQCQCIYTVGKGGDNFMLLVNYSCVIQYTQCEFLF